MENLKISLHNTVRILPDSPDIVEEEQRNDADYDDDDDDNFANILENARSQQENFKKMRKLKEVEGNMRKLHNYIWQ